MVLLLREGSEKTPALEGEPFLRENILDGQKAVQHYFDKKGFVAPVYLLLERFPHRGWITTNTEEISGIDKYGKFGAKGEAVIVTIQGGIEGWNYLKPEIVQEGYRRGNVEGNTFSLSQILGGNRADSDFARMINEGILPDGSTIPILSYDDFLKIDDPVMEFKRFGVITSLSVRRQSSGSINGLISKLCDDFGRIVDPQVILYAGGISRAQKFIERLRRPKIKGLGLKNLGITKPFDLREFNSEEVRGCFVYINDIYGLVGYTYGGNICSCFIGVNPVLRRSSDETEMTWVLEDRINVA